MHVSRGHRNSLEQRGACIDSDGGRGLGVERARVALWLPNPSLVLAGFLGGIKIYTAVEAIVSHLVAEVALGLEIRSYQ